MPDAENSSLENETVLYLHDGSELGLKTIWSSFYESSPNTAFGQVQSVGAFSSGTLALTGCKRFFAESLVYLMLLVFIVPAVCFVFII